MKETDVRIDHPRRILEFVRAHHCVTLATCGIEGPWASTVFYANDGFDLIFLTDPRTRHGLNLARDPRVAATIDDDVSTYEAVKGVQLEGTAAPIDGFLEKTTAVALYLAKYPFVRELFGGHEDLGMFLQALEAHEVYLLRPTRVCFVDNAYGRERVELTGAALSAPPL